MDEVIGVSRGEKPRKRHHRANLSPPAHASTHGVLTNSSPWTLPFEKLTLSCEHTSQDTDCFIENNEEGESPDIIDTSNTETDLNIFKIKTSGGPHSILGTGSSIASASDHSEVSGSDFESDSGIESSHIENTENTSPDITMAISSTSSSKRVEPFVDVMPHDDLAVTVGMTETTTAMGGAGEIDQSDQPGEDGRIDSFIQCLDQKVDKNSLTKEALKLLSLIPDGYIPLPHQVGGHRHVEGKIGFLRRVGQRDILYKPSPGKRGLREIHFYKNISASYFDDIPQELMVLKELVPKYYGTHDIVDRSGEIHKFIKLEDIVNRFHKPCIMDVKVGRRVWDDFAEQDKIEREKKKYPPQEIIGFRIIGMRVYKSATGDYEYYNKEYGRSVSVNGALDAVSNFFMDGGKKRSDVIGPIMERLYFFLRWMEQQKLFKLFATSLIIVYEGDTRRPIRKPRDLLDIRLVDFAHAYERNQDETCEPDYNILFGLQNFIRYLEQLNGSDKA